MDLDGEQQAAARGRCGEGRGPDDNQTRTRHHSGQEQSTGFFYRGSARTFAPPGGFTTIDQRLRTWLGNVSYVTGAHAFKAGYSHTWARSISDQRDVKDSLSYRFNNGIPNLIYQRATPYSQWLRDERRAGPSCRTVDHQPDDRELRGPLRLSSGY
jgi:hypothetical protein